MNQVLSDITTSVIDRAVVLNSKSVFMSASEICVKRLTFIFVYIGLGKTVFLLPHVRYITDLYKSIEHVNYIYSNFIFPNLINSAERVG
jgi:hypothetical protein